jgi:hypothetical protein
MLNEMARTNAWPARQWETPTAADWVDAELRLQVFRARVQDGALRELAGNIRTLAMKSVWAASPDEAKQLNPQVEHLHEQFNDLVKISLSQLYRQKVRPLSGNSFRSDTGED